jgi:hypothetical protein
MLLYMCCMKLGQSQTVRIQTGSMTHGLGCCVYFIVLSVSRYLRLLMLWVPSRPAIVLQVPVPVTTDQPVSSCSAIMHALCGQLAFDDVVRLSLGDHVAHSSATSSAAWLSARQPAVLLQSAGQARRRSQHKRRRSRLIKCSGVTKVSSQQ